MPIKINRTAVLVLVAIHIVMILTSCSVVNRVRYRNCPISLIQDVVQFENPGKIIIEFSLRTCNGDPVPYLTKDENFSILEDGLEISEFEAKFDFKPSPKPYEYDAILLLDMSGSIVEAGNLQALIDSAKIFVENTAEGNRIAVYTFDGRPGYNIEQVVDFTDDVSTLQDGIQGLDSYMVVDSSTNIYGAVEESIKILNSRDSRLNNSIGLLQAKSLFVFTDGKHRASAGKKGYPDWSTVESVVEKSQHSIFTIGLGGEIDKRELKKIGRNGQTFADDIEDLPTNVFKDLVESANSSYIVAYCSPARAGTHSMTVQVEWKGMTGETAIEFDANDFSGGCTPEL